MTWVDACAASLPDGTLAQVPLAGTAAVLARVNGEWHALEAWCTHAECPLGDGWLEGAAIRCACHGALFDVVTGSALEGPAEEPVRVIDTRVVDGRVEVAEP